MSIYNPDSTHGLCECKMTFHLIDHFKNKICSEKQILATPAQMQTIGDTLHGFRQKAKTTKTSLSVGLFLYLIKRSSLKTSSILSDTKVTEFAISCSTPLSA